MKESARYAKIIEWSEEDRIYIGTVPGLFYGGCHGDNEQAVFAELCDITEENIEIYHKRGIPLPPPTISGRLADTLLKWGSAEGLYAPAGENTPLAVNESKPIKY